MQIGTSFVEIANFWTNFKAICSTKRLAIQYEDDTLSVGNLDYLVYQIFAIDGSLLYRCTIFKGTVPPGIINSYDQGTNDADKTNWETFYKPFANMPIDYSDTYKDPRIIHRFGNLVATSASEVLVSTRAYVEPASQAQRSVKSSSAVDSDALGTGARQIRITYLDSSYNLKSEDVLLNGTGAVNTVATDIRFIESLEVIKGTTAVGAISLMTLVAGGGTEICGIAAATSQSFLCHHYVPVGKRAMVVSWGATVDDECSFKLNGQDRFGSNLVDRIFDLDKLFFSNPSPPTRLDFERQLKGIILPEKTYCRISVVPNQATSTTIRARLDLWEIPI